MTTVSRSPRARDAATGWSPRRILCAVDGSRGSAAAVREALALAPAEAAVGFLAVTWDVGYGRVAVATVSPARAQRAVDEAVREARGAGRAATPQLVEHRDAGEAILEAAAGRDLLVIGTSHHGRAGGIALGRVATVVAHRAPCDVVLARPSAASGGVLVAFDGSPSAWRAAQAACAIAGADGSTLTIVSVGRSGAERRRALASVTASVIDVIGREPVIVTPEGSTAHRIVELAAELGVSLVAVGSRRLTGVRALGSVSERVAHTAPCSVLIARGG